MPRTRPGGRHLRAVCVPSADCRTYGPPILIGAEPLPPCRLCFEGSAPEEIERCRVEPDPPGMEGAVLEGMSDLDGEDRETVIAHALAAGDTRRPLPG